MAIKDEARSETFFDCKRGWLGEAFSVLISELFHPSFARSAQPSWNFRAKARFVISPFIYILFVLRRSRLEVAIPTIIIYIFTCSEQDFLAVLAVGAHSLPFSLAHSLSTFIFHLAIFMHRFNPHIHEIYTQRAKKGKFPQSFPLATIFFCVFRLRCCAPTENEARTKEEIF